MWICQRKTFILGLHLDSKPYGFIILQSFLQIRSKAFLCLKFAVWCVCYKIKHISFVQNVLPNLLLLHMINVGGLLRFYCQCVVVNSSRDWHHSHRVTATLIAASYAHSRKTQDPGFKKYTSDTWTRSLQGMLALVLHCVLKINQVRTIWNQKKSEKLLRSQQNKIYTYSYKIRLTIIPSNPVHS